MGERPLPRQAKCSQDPYLVYLGRDRIRFYLNEMGNSWRAARDLRIDLVRSWMVGDRWRDIDCGQNAGCRTVFIDHGYGEALRARPDFTVHDFAAAVEVILKNQPD